MRDNLPKGNGMLPVMSMCYSWARTALANKKHIDNDVLLSLKIELHLANFPIF